ncbi:invasion associated locus B family protein [Bradyrhizobium sp.]|uniref:invasion associated locus B family protein n=1 Tax=Bradyrhizobium sp. TaxID=376 RepID=UPI003C290F6C
MKLARLAMVAVLATLSAAGTSSAQQKTPKAKGQGQGQAQTQPTSAPSPSGTPAPPAQPGWAVRCSSPSREAPLECAMEQNAILIKTGQLVVLVNIRVPGDTRAPIALVQLPLGLNLQAGAKFQIDDGKSADLPIQTCENRGCYASVPISSETLNALKAGKQLKISFQDLGKETITVPLSLNDFSAAYDKIK